MSAKLPKPLFAALAASYEPAAAGVHDCPLFDPTRDPIHSGAARVTEALVVATGLSRTRGDLTAPFEASRTHRSKEYLLDVRPPGGAPALGRFDYQRFGKLCPHGLAAGAEELAAFLTHHWGAPAMKWAKPVSEPKELQGKRGILVFLAVPGFIGQGHVDLWDGTAVLGKAFWDATAVALWSLA